MKKIFFKKFNNKKEGYTIIETMIAVALFIIIVMIGMGALLNANLLHQKSQDMRSIMDNLSFVMEDMSRNIRTGYEYGDLSNGGGISFKSSVDDVVTQWTYYIDINPNTGNTYSVFRSINEETIQLTSDEVDINPVSGFTILGAEPPPDTQQPIVTIRLVGTITYKDVVTPFSLQTSVSQRAIDI